MQSSKNLFLVRHAQTVFNSNQIIQGQSFESELSDEGIKQAEDFYGKFKHIPFDKIYISGLRRTYDSVRNFIVANVAFEIIPELNELNWGIIEGNKFEGEIKKKYLTTLESWKKGNYDARIENGESAFDVVHRLNNAIDIIMHRENEENIMLVTHNGTLKILLCILLRININRMDSFSHKNLTIYQISYLDQNFFLTSKFTECCSI